MPSKYYDSHRRWNTANYKQINIAVRPELSDEFKAACARNDISMREAIINLMAAYAAAPTPAKKLNDKGYSERGRRRKAVSDIITQLTEIRDAEDTYKENIPENLKASSRYESAEQAVESLDEAIERLEAAFS